MTTFCEATNVNVTEFKAKCLELLDRVGSHDIKTLTVTKPSKAIAAISAPSASEDQVRSLHGAMRGRVIIPAGFDLTETVLDEELDAELGLLHR